MKTTAMQSLHWNPTLKERFWAYQEIYGKDSYFSKQVAKPLIRLLGAYLKDYPTILDYGCGPGYLTEELLRLGHIVFSYDRFCASANDLPVCKADVIFALELIEHLYDDELDAVIADIKRSLAPNGRVIFTTPYAEDLKASTVFCPSCSHTFHRMQHVRSWTLFTLTAFLEERGFIVEKTFVTDLTACYSNRPWVRLKDMLGLVPATNLIVVCRG